MTVEGLAKAAAECGVTEREWNIISLHAGLHRKPLTFKVIGQQLGISKERVRQIESVGLRKMRSRIHQSITLIGELDNIHPSDAYEWGVGKTYVLKNGNAATITCTSGKPPYVIRGVVHWIDGPYHGAFASEWLANGKRRPNQESAYDLTTKVTVRKNTT